MKVLTAHRRSTELFFPFHSRNRFTPKMFECQSARRKITFRNTLCVSMQALCLAATCPTMRQLSSPATCMGFSKEGAGVNHIPGLRSNVGFLTHNKPFIKQGGRLRSRGVYLWRSLCAEVKSFCSQLSYLLFHQVESLF